MGSRTEPPAVLIADNDAAVNALLVESLEDRGLRCESVLDGELALARVQRGGIAVLVTDLDMPNLDGRGLLEGVSGVESPPASVVISGFLDAEVERALLALPGVRHILKKPFDVLRFADLVADLVGEVGRG